MHNRRRFNCLVFLKNGRILLIRPKMNLADSGNYRETRWFSKWTSKNLIEHLLLPNDIANQTGQVHSLLHRLRLLLGIAL